MAGQYDEAERLLLRGLKELEALEPGHPDLAFGHYELGSVYMEQRRLELAEQHLEKARQLYLQTDSDPQNVHDTTHLLAAVLDYRGETARAEREFRMLLAAAEERHGPEHLDVAGACHSIAVTLSKQGKLEDAARFDERAVQIAEKLGDDEYLAHALNGLGSTYYQMDRLDDAAEVLERALEVREKLSGPGHPAVATVLFNLAGVEEERGDLQRASSHCRRCLEIRFETLPADHPWLAEAIERCAGIEDAAGRPEEAARLRARLSEPESTP